MHIEPFDFSQWKIMYIRVKNRDVSLATPFQFFLYGKVMFVIMKKDKPCYYFDNFSGCAARIYILHMAKEMHFKLISCYDVDKTKYDMSRQICHVADKVCVKNINFATSESSHQSHNFSQIKKK